MFKRVFVLAILILALAISNLSTVFACSGYPYFGVDDLPTMELLVRATVLDADDRGHNAIIRVDEYYKGEGAELLTVMRYPVGLETGAGWRGYSTSCLYTGRGHGWRVGTTGYFGLLSNGDGTYTDENGGTAHFYPMDGVIEYEEGATEGYAVEFDDPYAIREDEFIDLLLEVGERDEPLLPDTEEVQFYPLMRLLNITTENGTRYYINPDRSVTRLPDNAPIAISPDGAHVAFQLTPDTVAFRYIWTTPVAPDTEERNFPDQTQQLQVPGQAVRFANDSSFAAVYDAEQLTVVMLVSSSPYTATASEYGYGGMTVRQIAHVDFSPFVNGKLPDVQWSADSTTLAWQDRQGLWHWNLIEAAEPTLIDVRASQPLLDISRHGRFLRYGDPTDWTLLDTVTGETYANTTISPDERFLVAIRPDSEVENIAECVPPLRDNCMAEIQPSYLRPDDDAAVSIFPYRSELMGIVACNAEFDGRCLYEGLSWHPAIGTTSWVGGRYIKSSMSDVRLMDYDPQYDQPALVVGDYDVYFWFYSDATLSEPIYAPYIDRLQLEDVIDSPIASIEWGTPIFYDEYILSTLDHYPR